MQKAFLAEMRASLIALQGELQSVSDVTESSAQPVELDQQRVGRLSRMDAIQVQAMARAAGRRREATLRDIAAALARMESGDFGHCQGCDEPIEENRLRFDPTVALCIDCANAAENTPRNRVR